MSRSNYLCAVLAFASLPPLGAATEFQAEGQLDLRLGYGMHHSHHQWKEQKARLQLALEADTDTLGRIRLSGVGYYDHAYNRQPYADTPAQTLKDYGELKDAYWLYETDSTALTIGKQQLTWGESDYYRVVDIINPLDLSDYLLTYLDDFALAKQSLTMANFEYFGEEWTQQWLWIWQFEPTRLPPSGAQFASPLIEGYHIAAALLPEQRPKSFSLDDSSVGAKFNRAADFGDVALFGYYGWNPDPVVSGTGISWHRRNMLGASLSHPAGDWVLRSDLSLWLDDAVGTRDHAVLKRNRGNLLIAADYNSANYSVSLQAYQSSVLNRQAGDDLAIPAHELALSLYADRRFLADNLLLSGLWLHSTETDVGLAQLSMEYRLRDDLSLALIGNLFWGDEPTTLFSDYQDQNRLTLKASYYF